MATVRTLNTTHTVNSTPHPMPIWSGRDADKNRSTQRRRWSGGH
jgi:hypothetical protein